jgi:hypothetical protein
MSIVVNREEKIGKPFQPMADRTDVQPLLVIKVPTAVIVGKLMALTIVAVMALLAIGVEYLNSTDHQSAWGWIFLVILVVYLILIALVLHQRTKILGE